MNSIAHSTSIPAERSVLGSLMRFPDRFSAIAALVSADDFSTSAHRTLFKTMAAQVKASRGIDPIALMDVMGDRVDQAYLMELASNAYSREGVVEHARIVRDHAIRRSVIAYGEQIAKNAGESFDVESLLSEASQGLSKVGSRLKAENAAESYRDMMDRFILMMKERAKNETGVIGISTGLRELDEMTSGLHDEDYIVVAGRPSMGKTAFAMGLVESALAAGKRAMVFSMEMPREALLQRSIASIGRIDQTRLRTGRLTDEDMVRFEQAVAILNGFNILVDDTPALSLSGLVARAHEAHREEELDLIMIDYLQLMKILGNDNRTDGIGDISRGIKELAKQLKVPIIVLSQLNRSLEQRPNKRPINSDLRESGSIEQDADVILFVYRDEVYEPDSPDKGIAEIIIGKQRNGPLGTARVRFIGPFTRFEDLDASERASRPAQAAAAAAPQQDSDGFIVASDVDDAFDAPLNGFGPEDDQDDDTPF